MLCKLLLSLSTAASLAVAGLIPVRDADSALLGARKDTCSTTTVYQSYHYVNIYQSTTTVTYGYSQLGRVTSTKTELETRTINKQSTVTFPTLVSSPTTTASPIVATVTTTIPYMYITSTVTSPGYAPTELCQDTTFRHVIPETTTVTVNRDLTFATDYTSTTGHVTTTTKVFFTTTTRTVTTPGPTTWAVTITEPRTVTSVDWTIPTVTSVVWERGCESYACQS